MSGGGSRLELSCVLHWFSLWDAQQKEAFARTLLPHLGPSSTTRQEGDPDDLCGQLGGLSLLSAPRCPPVLECQLSLCQAYFCSWGPRGVWQLVQLLAHRDAHFVARLLGSLVQHGGDPFLARPATAHPPFPL